MKFKQHPVSKHLQHLVAYYWTLTADDNNNEASVYRFVPDGMIDWVFHLDTPWQHKFANSNINCKTPHFHVFGQITNYLDLDISKSNLNIFGIKFYPWVGKQVFKTDMYYLTDNCLCMDDLKLPNIEHLFDRLLTCKTTNERVLITENYLLKTFTDFNTNSLKTIFKNFDHLPLDLDFYKLNVSKRRLEQRFKQEIGLSPNRFNRIMRINRVIKDLKTDNTISLTQLALHHGFYDQSHFVKDFKQFTGYSPTRFLESIQPDGDILNLRVR